MCNPYVLLMLEVFYYSHLTDEETEAQTSEETWTGSQIEVAGGRQDLYPGSLPLGRGQQPVSMKGQKVNILSELAAITQLHFC